jgi:hypothetical protein
MAFEVEIQVSDPKFFEALGNPEGFMPILGEAMTNIITRYRELAEVYAPESEANKPGRFNPRTGEPMGYYERGRGWWYPVLGHRALGLMGEIPLLRPHLKSPKTMGATALLAVGFQGVAGYKLRATSEQMHDRWSTEVQQNAEDVIGMLSNIASYSGLVVGLEQVELHRSRGWQTVVDVWDSTEMELTVDTQTAGALREYYNI